MAKPSTCQSSNQQRPPTTIMDERTRRGYARLVRDLAELDRDDRFQETLARAYGAMEELSHLIDRAKVLGKDEEDPSHH